MSPQARDRAEERRLSIRTLAIASASSATAAIVTSRLWADGTPIAAAMTPVIVTIISESLNRPTAKIAERLTVDSRGRPKPMRGGPPQRNVKEGDPEPGRGRPSGALPDDVRVYRSGSRSGSRKPRLSWKLILTTAALAFVIGLVVLTLPQVFAGESLLKGSPPGYGTASKKKSKSKPAGNDGRQAPTQTEQEPDTPAPETTTPTEEPDPETAPETTTPVPEEEPPADAPAPRAAPPTQPGPGRGRPQP